MNNNVLKTVLAGIGVVVLAFVTARLGVPAPAPVPHPAGGVSSPDIPSPYLSWGGVRQWAAQTTLTQNASTTCSLQAPVSTSTLQEAGINFLTASSASLTVDIGQAANQYSTTTLIGTTYTIGAGAQAFIQASTSPAAGAATVFGPNQWLNFKIGGGGTGSLPVGTCNAVWNQA